MSTAVKTPKRNQSRPQAQPATPGLDHDLSFLLLRAFYNLRGMLGRMLVDHGLSDWVQPGMGPILYALYEQDDCTIREIGERILLAPSTLTNTLKRMEKKGLVEITRDAEDRRAVRVRLTQQARDLEPRMRDMRREVRSVLQGDMSDRDVRRTKESLVQLIESIDINEWEAKHPRNKRGGKNGKPT